jgi:hypothetical protein
MKHYLLSLIFLSALIASQNVSAQTGKCEKTVDVKSSPVVTPRGGNQKVKIDMKNGIRHYLQAAKKKKKAVAPKCMISLYNEIDQEVDIYVDGNYMGSLRAKAQGVIESIESYSEVYCLSSDREVSWSEAGNCSCIYVFNLKNEKK